MSSLVFNANEAFEVARRIEQNGIAYYRRAATLIAAPAARKLMNDLAEMEVVHEQVFAHMQRQLSEEENGETPFDPHDDAFTFLKSMADKWVFEAKAAPQELIKDGTDAKTILLAAIEREKDSIIFYEGIKVMVPQKFGGARLDEIIAQEMGHVIILTRHLEQLQ